MNAVIEQAKNDITDIVKILFYALITTVSNYYIIGEITVTSFIFVFFFIFISNILLTVFVYNKLIK